MYETLLKDASASDRDEIIYQLARAYDVSGNPVQARAYLDRLIAEAPQSPHIVEARFRRAEMSFSNDAYRQAAPDYEYVVVHGEGSPYWLNAAYMLGWCQFKESDHDAALDSFFDALGPEGIQALEVATIDMSGAFKKAFRERAPRHRL